MQLLGSRHLECLGQCEPARQRRMMNVANETGSGKRGVPSLGSVNHKFGRCKPCAFVHRPIGCADGATCSFCHTCEPGEKKKRQKQKMEAIQARRTRKKTSGSSAEAETEAQEST